MLYQGRYLICHYDHDGVLDGVFDNAKEFMKFLNERGKVCCIKNINTRLSRIFNGTTKSRDIAFVDVFETHDDNFRHEDNVFIEEMFQAGSIDNKTKKQKAKELGMSRRNYFRKISVFNQRQEEEMSR